MTYNQKIPPFKWFILENFPYIEEDFDALTNWQLFCKLGKEMNKIIEKTNLTGEQVEQLTTAFNELKAYIDNYFENLDVQDEIDNKLDEMAEQGVLTDIIAQYLQLAGVLAYDNKQAMKQAQNLADGSIAKTLGKTTYKDGQGAFYKVRQIQNTDVVDDENIIALYDTDLVAEKILYSSGYEIQTTLQPQIDLINSERTILIGDSYSVYRPDTEGIEGWAVPLRRILGLSNDDCPILASNGGGFITQGSLGTFQEALTNATISNHNTIKNIIVCAGINDFDNTKSEIKTAISNFITYAKTNYPNAKIYLGMISWDNDEEYTIDNQYSRYRLLNNVLPAYQESSEYGAIYLNGVENVMHNYVNYYDRTHPDQTGCLNLAKYIYQAFKNGYASVSYIPHRLTFTNTNISTENPLLYEQVINNETVFYDINENGTTITYSSNYPTTSNNQFYFANVVSNYARCVNGNDHLFSCPAIITATDNTSYKVSAAFYMKNWRYVHCHFTSTQIQDGLSIKSITLLNPYSSKPTVFR